jgi:hypothetical protein
MQRQQDSGRGRQSTTPRAGNPRKENSSIEPFLKTVRGWGIIWAAVWGLVHAWRRFVTFPSDWDDPICQIALCMALVGIGVVSQQSGSKAERRISLWMVVWGLTFQWRSWAAGSNSLDDPLWWFAGAMFVLGGIAWRRLLGSR